MTDQHFPFNFPFFSAYLFSSFYPLFKALCSVSEILKPVLYYILTDFVVDFSISHHQFTIIFTINKLTRRPSVWHKTLLVLWLDWFIVHLALAPKIRVSKHAHGTSASGHPDVWKFNAPPWPFVKPFNVHENRRIQDITSF